MPSYPRSPFERTIPPIGYFPRSPFGKRKVIFDYTSNTYWQVGDSSRAVWQDPVWRMLGDTVVWRANISFAGIRADQIRLIGNASLYPGGFEISVRDANNNSLASANPYARGEWLDLNWVGYDIQTVGVEVNSGYPADVIAIELKYMQSPVASTWVSYTEETTYWVEGAGGDMTWNEGVWTFDSANGQLDVSGSWYDGYRPTHIRIWGNTEFYNGVDMELLNSEGSSIASLDNYNGRWRQITTEVNIDKLFLTSLVDYQNAVVYSIEFRTIV